MYSRQASEKGRLLTLMRLSNQLRQAVDQAERMIGMSIREVILGIPANGVMLQDVKGVVAVNSENREITDDDLDRVMKSAQVMSVSPEREIVNVIPKQFIVDDLDEIKDPRGMIGVRLEMDGTLYYDFENARTQYFTLCRASRSFNQRNLFTTACSWNLRPY